MEPKPKTNPLFYIIFIGVLLYALLTLWPKIKRDVNEGVQTPAQSTSITTEAPAILVDENLFESIKVQEEGPYTLVDFSYPRFKDLGTVYNLKIENKYRDFIKEHAQISEENFKARLDTMTEEEKKYYTPSIKKEDKFPAQGTFQVVQANPQFISVLFTLSAYQGGAHGFQISETFNYDVQNKKELSLVDVLSVNNKTLDFVSEESRKQLLQEFLPQVPYQKLWKDIVFDGEEDMFFAETLYTGTEPKKDNFAVFTFTPQTITIYFQQYQVGPYVIGSPMVTISRI